MKSVSVKVKMSILSLKQTSLGISYYVLYNEFAKNHCRRDDSNRFKIVFQQAMEYLILQLGKNLNSNTRDITGQSLIEKVQGMNLTSPR